ncbi:MAG TPA: hypothetical protein ENN89_01055 [Synergistetes bacterium]|nr:hypothetical protein [Synergistota bacterium]
MHYGKLEPAGYLTGENAIMTWIAGIRHSHLDDHGYSLDQKLLLEDAALEEQVKKQVEEAQWRMVLNSLILCLFARGVYDSSTISKGLEALGLDWSPNRLKELGAATLKAKYAWKKKCGFDPHDIAIPEKMFRVRTSNGLIDRERMKKRLELFLRYAGLE